MAMSFLRLLPLLLMLLPPPLRDYLWAAKESPMSEHVAGRQLEVYHPIILLPGLSCPDLEARLTDAYTPSLPQCGALKVKGWFPLWNNTWDVVKHDYLPCFEEQMSLVFDPFINDYRNLPGVETRVPGFGSAYAVTSKTECPSCCTIMLREELEALGYRDKDTLFGAPYDLRHAPPLPGQPSEVYSVYFAHVKDLVEHASEKNANKPVIFVGHSFGAKVVLDFINSTPLPWRKKFVKHIVLISPTPPTGFMQVVTNLASGPTVFHIPNVPQLSLRSMWRTFPISHLSLPSPMVFGHEPLVITKHKNYSAYDYGDFLVALGFTTNEIFPSTKWVLPTDVSVEAPMVPTTYITGVGVGTPEQAIFWEDNFDVDPYIMYGDGDGCINWVSVLAFAKELHRQHQPHNIPIKFVKIPKATHSNIVVEEDSLKRVITEILEANS